MNVNFKFQISNFVSRFDVLSKKVKKITLLIFYHSSVSKIFFAVFRSMPLHITKILQARNLLLIKQIVLVVMIKNLFPYQAGWSDNQN